MHDSAGYRLLVLLHAMGECDYHVSRPEPLFYGSLCLGSPKPLHEVRKPISLTIVLATHRLIQCLIQNEFLGTFHLHGAISPIRDPRLGKSRGPRTPFFRCFSFFRGSPEFQFALIVAWNYV